LRLEIICSTQAGSVLSVISCLIAR
jgi:hypothetical protein